MSATHTEFRFILEAVDGPAGSYPAVLALPPGVSSLAAAGGENSENNSTIPAIIPDSAAGPVAFEPMAGGPQPRLLMLSKGQYRPLVNGRRAPLVAVLHVGDGVTFPSDANHQYHLTAYSRPSLGPPPAEKVGKPCPICSVEFTAQTTVYTCECGTVSHSEPDGPEALQCIGDTCVDCGRPVQRKQGYAFRPEGFQDDSVRDPDNTSDNSNH